MDPHIRVAVVAVDPSSEVSGGALLGDRTRVRFPVDEDRLFFRSQASDRQLGGMSPGTFQVCRLLYHLFDLVIIETVGIGQNEIEVQRLADRVYLVLQPLAGDQIQFLKAGIMEIPDVFLLNKSDEVEAARKTYHALKASIQFTRPGDGDIQILQTSAVMGTGIDEVCADLMELVRKPRDGESLMREKEERYFSQWVREEYGRSGIKKLLDLGGAAFWIKECGSYDAATRRLIDKFN
jgi:LAO/AO transport system kinase